MTALRRGAAAAATAALLAAGCRGEPPPEGAPPTGAAGTFVVVTDSSRVYFVLPTAREPIRGSFPNVRGALTLEEDSRRFLSGTGALQVDLTVPDVPDSSQAAALRERFLQVDRNPEFRTAEVAVRELTGHNFRSGGRVGDVRPVRVLARLTVHGMALTRAFEGEMTPTSAGWRLTTVAPVVFSLRELRMDDELAELAGDLGLEPGGDLAVATVDLWLSRRASPAGGADRAEEATPEERPAPSR